MKKIQKLMAVSTFCFASAFAVNCLSSSTSNVWGAIDYFSPNKTRAEWFACKGAETASTFLAGAALAGTGISAVGSGGVTLAIII